MKRFAAWLAAAAMALNALWPLLAHAGPGEFSAPVCTTSAVLKFAPPAGGLPISPPELKAPHCPFCGSTGGAIAAPPASPVVVFAVTAAHERPAGVGSAPSHSFQFLRAPPRGPPVPVYSS